MPAGKIFPGARLISRMSLIYRTAHLRFTGLNGIFLLDHEPCIIVCYLVISRIRQAGLHYCRGVFNGMVMYICIVLNAL